MRDDDRFDAWLRRILVHACYAEARRRRAWAANVRVLPTDGPEGRDDIATVIDRDRLERAFRRLSPEQGAIFVLHHYVGLTLPEIADELGVPLGTVKSRMHYATETLRAALDADARTGHTDGASRMTTDRDFDRIAAAWLADGPDELPDRVHRRRRRPDPPDSTTARGSACRGGCPP